MGKLAERITAAETKLNTAKESKDEAAQAVAEAELSTLRSLDSEGWVPQTDVSGSAASARTEGRSAGETAERERIRKLYGLSDGDDLDAAIKSAAERRRNEQSDVERFEAEKKAAEEAKEAAEKERDEARTRYESTLKRTAVREALIAEGVRHTDEDSRLDMALYNTDLSEVLMDDEGNVSGADKAAKATKEKVSEWFGATNKQGPPEAPEDKGGRNNGESAYKPRYSVPGKK